MITPVDYIDVDGRLGPKKDMTKAAQLAIDEFVAADATACIVDWSKISPDFDKAKAQLSARISWTRHWRGIKDLGIRTNRSKGLVYLVRKDRLEQDV